MTTASKNSQKICGRSTVKAGAAKGSTPSRPASASAQAAISMLFLQANPTDRFSKPLDRKQLATYNKDYI